MNAFAALSQAVIPDHAFCLRLTIALAHLVWQGFAIAALSLVATRLFRQHSTEWRYAVNVVGLVLLACCLPATYLAVDVQSVTDPGIRLLERDIQVVDRGAALPTGSEPLQDGQFAEGADAARARGERLMGDSAGSSEAPPQAISENAATAPALHPGLQRFMEPAAPYAAAIYFLGVLTLSLRLILGLWGGHRLRRSASPMTQPDLLEVVRRQAQTIGLRLVPVVAWCQR